MNSIIRIAGASSLARTAVCIVLASISSASSLSMAQARWKPAASLNCAGKAEVAVYADWQARHISCTVTAVGQALGTPPAIAIDGASCFALEGTERIAQVKVSYSACDVTELYLVQAVGGVVEVDLIDLL